MSDPRYIDDEELEGRTVSKVVICDKSILLRFADGTFTGLHYESGYYSGDGDLQFFEPTDEDDLVKLGLLDGAQVAARRAEEKARREAFQRHNEEMQERYLYERLKAKYEPCPGNPATSEPRDAS